VGTAKPSPEDRVALRYHLLDLVDPSQPFTVRQFQAAAAEVLGRIEARGNRALLVGGTALYLRAVVDRLELPGRWPEVRARLERQADAPGGLAALYERLARLDPPAASRMTAANRRRVVRALEVTLGSGRPFSSFGPGLDAHPPSPVRLVGIPFDPPTVDRAIAERFRALLEAGLLDEVRQLAARPGGLSPTARQALGYRELLSHLEQGVPLELTIEEAVRRTRAFARRQWAWFRRDPRIFWLEAGRDPLEQLIEHWDQAGQEGRAEAVAVGDSG
jgi:tRNA dimethylallyltransferase